jgi:hypothetical protein
MPEPMLMFTISATRSQRPMPRRIEGLFIVIAAYDDRGRATWSSERSKLDLVDGTKSRLLCLVFVQGHQNRTQATEGVMRFAMLALALVLGTAAHSQAEDPFRVIKLEQDMRNLERQVQTLQRQLDEIRGQLGRSGDRAARPAAPGPAAPESQAWLNAANWDRVRNGMSELEVISLLGPPTTMRQEDQTRVLLYAMEIGSSGFLSGSISLRDRAVTEVSRPVLK